MCIHSCIYFQKNNQSQCLCIYHIYIHIYIYHILIHSIHRYIYKYSAKDQLLIYGSSQSSPRGAGNAIFSPGNVFKMGSKVWFCESNHWLGFIVLIIHNIDNIGIHMIYNGIFIVLGMCIYMCVCAYIKY